MHGLKPKMFLLTTLLVLLVSMSAAQEGSVELRVVHMSPGAAEVGVLVEGERAGEVIGFGESTGYIDLEQGAHEVELVSAGDTIVTREVELEGSHTLVLRDMSFHPDTTVLDDQSATKGVARVRLTHFSPDVLDVDVAMADGGSMAVNGLSYTEASRYMELEPGNYTMVVRDSSTGDRLLQQELRVRGSRTYTFFLSGLLREEPFFAARPAGNVQVPVENGDNGEQNGNGEENGEGGVVRQNFVIECRLVQEEG